MRTDCLACDDWGQPMGPINTTNALNAMSASNALSAMNTPYMQMTEALHWQQQRIIELEAENRELRRQLDDLRRGVGIALVIEGRQIPLASPAASMPRPSAGLAHDTPWTSGAHPSPSPTHPPIPSPPHTTPPPHRAQAQPSEAAFPENAWLTGPAPALKPAQPAQQQPARHTPRQESRRVEPKQPQSQQPPRFTPPAWLHEEAPTVASWEAEQQTSAPPSHLRIPARRQHIPHNPIPPVPAEIWHAEQQRDSGKFRTLAQMTGQHPAVRIPGKPQKTTGNTHSDGHSPFADSFVLG